HPHPRLRGGEPGGVVRGELPGVRGRQTPPPGRRGRPAAPDQVPEADPRVAGRAGGVFLAAESSWQARRRWARRSPCRWVRSRPMWKIGRVLLSLRRWIMRALSIQLLPIILSIPAVLIAGSTEAVRAQERTSALT